MTPANSRDRSELETDLATLLRLPADTLAQIRAMDESMLAELGRIVLIGVAAVRKRAGS